MTDTLTLPLLRAGSNSGEGQSWLTSLADWTVSLMEIIGPVGAGVAIALENLFPPLPSEVVLPMAPTEALSEVSDLRAVATGAILMKRVMIS